MDRAVPSPTVARPYTEEEYLRLEAAATERHEFRGGRIVAMAGGTAEHSIIAVNLGGELRTRLRDGPCLTFGSDVRVRIAANGEYVYPDVSVVCEPPVYVPPNRRQMLVNPQVVIEVLSASTMDDDLGEKLDNYLSIESLQEYVVVAQDQPWARSFRRGPDRRWGIGPFVRGLEKALVFASPGVEVPMAEVYAKVTFPTNGKSVGEPTTLPG